MFLRKIIYRGKKSIWLSNRNDIFIENRVIILGSILILMEKVLYFLKILIYNLLLIVFNKND